MKTRALEFLGGARTGDKGKYAMSVAKAVVARTGGLGVDEVVEKVLDGFEGQSEEGKVKAT